MTEMCYNYNIQPKVPWSIKTKFYTLKFKNFF